MARLSSFAVDPEFSPDGYEYETPSDTSEPQPSREWSKQQEAIFLWFAAKPITWFDVNRVNPADVEKIMGGQWMPVVETNDKHPAVGQISQRNLVVRARAGTGKTTTIIEGINRAPDFPILVTAFNKGIADELNDRITNPGATAKTLHALGLEMIRRQWRRMPVEDNNRRGERADWLTAQALSAYEKTHEKVPTPIRFLISRLHTYGREMTPLTYHTPGVVLGLAFRFNLIPDEAWRDYNVGFVVENAIAAIDHAAKWAPVYEVGVDYADMIFLPLAHNLTAKDYALVVVDEAQDLTVAQLEIARRVCSGRICIVGDDRQAIYGFRGADVGSLDRLKTELGAMELPLTVTYRCAKNIVARAQKLVPDIEAYSTNPDGQLDSIDLLLTPDKILDEALPGDFILSRLNAPLVGLTLALLRRGKRARMLGKNIGDDVAKILKRLRCVDGTPIEDTLSRIHTWESKTITKLAAYGQHDLIERTRDQAGILYALSEDTDTTGDLLRKCEWLFTNNIGDQIVLSTVHKAKGKETDRVFVLMDTLYHRGRSREEENIEYVAQTRAKKHLTLVN